MKKWCHQPVEETIEFVINHVIGGSEGKMTRSTFFLYFSILFLFSWNTLFLSSDRITRQWGEKTSRTGGRGSLFVLYHLEAFPIPCSSPLIIPVHSHPFFTPSFSLPSPFRHPWCPYSPPLVPIIPALWSRPNLIKTPPRSLSSRPVPVIDV